MKQTAAHIHAMTIEVAAKRGKDDAMTDIEIMRILLPAKEAVDRLKRGEAYRVELFELSQFFMVSATAVDHAPTAEEGRELLAKRRAAVEGGLDAIAAMHYAKRSVAKGSELKSIDEAYTAAVELHYVLPEWCFLQAGLDYIKYELKKEGILPNRRSKTKRKPRVRRARK